MNSYGGGEIFLTLAPVCISVLRDIYSRVHRPEKLWEPHINIYNYGIIVGYTSRGLKPRRESDHSEDLPTCQAPLRTATLTGFGISRVTVKTPPPSCGVCGLGKCDTRKCVHTAPAVIL